MTVNIRRHYLVVTGCIAEGTIDAINSVKKHLGLSKQDPNTADTLR